MLTPELNRLFIRVLTDYNAGKLCLLISLDRFIQIQIDEATNQASRLNLQAIADYTCHSF